MLGTTFCFHSLFCYSRAICFWLLRSQLCSLWGDLGTLLIPLVLFTILSSCMLLPHLSLSNLSDFPPSFLFRSHSDLPLSKKFKILSEHCTPKPDVTCKRNVECVTFNTQLLKCIIVEKFPSIDKYSVNTSGALQEFRMINHFTHLQFYLTSILLFWTSFCSCFIFYPLPHFHQLK